MSTHIRQVMDKNIHLERYEFQADVERFLISRRMSASRFGRNALDQASFVTRLRGGAAVTRDTMQRVRGFMEQRQ